jgi:hypothetical protein
VIAREGRALYFHQRDGRMRKPVVIRTPFPTTEEVARKMGVSPAHTKELQKMVAEIVERWRKREEEAARKAAKNGRPTKRKRTAAKARAS